MMLAVDPHFRKASLHPTPSRHPCTIERLEERQEVHVNAPKQGDTVSRKEREIPFHGPNAGILEVDPAEPIRRKEVVASLRFAVQPLFWKGTRVEPAHQVREGRAQESPVAWSQGRYSEVIEQCGLCALQAVSKTRECKVTLAQRPMESVQRLTNAGTV